MTGVGPRLSPHIKDVKLVKERLMICILNTEDKKKISFISSILTTARNTEEENAVLGNCR